MTEKQEKVVKVLTRVAGGDLDLVIAGLGQEFESMDDVVKWILTRVEERKRDEEKRKHEERCEMFGVDP